MKATIQGHRGDLDAAESACADMQIDLDEFTPKPSFMPSSSRKRPRDPDSDVLESLQRRVDESGAILRDLSKAQQQPITARIAFANYVNDSLVTMPKYKKARSAINRILSELMDEESDDDIPIGLEASPIKGTQQASHPQPHHQPRPISAPPFWSFSSLAPSFSKHYQKPHNMMMNASQASSVWGSQSNDYMDQFSQQLLKDKQHHMTPTPLQQMMPPPHLSQQLLHQTQQQPPQKCTPIPTPVCDSLGSAAQVLRECPGQTQRSPGSAFEHNNPNISTVLTLSGFRDTMGSHADYVGSQDEVLHS